MLDFWGTWCVPCLKSMPAVQWIYDHFKNRDVEVIGVSVEMENAVDVPGYINRKGYTYPIALDGKTIAGDYKVTQYPTIYIIDEKRQNNFRRGRRRTGEEKRRYHSNNSKGTIN